MAIFDGDDGDLGLIPDHIQTQETNISSNNVQSSDPAVLAMANLDSTTRNSEEHRERCDVFVFCAAIAVVRRIEPVAVSMKHILTTKGSLVDLSRKLIATTRND